MICRSGLFKNALSSLSFQILSALLLHNIALIFESFPAILAKVKALKPLTALWNDLCLNNTIIRSRMIIVVPIKSTQLPAAKVYS